MWTTEKLTRRVTAAYMHTGSCLDFTILENDKCMVDLDIIGCSDDDNLASEKEYNSTLR